jgi:hypothetical protein
LLGGPWNVTEDVERGVVKARQRQQHGLWYPEAREAVEHRLAMERLDQEVVRTGAETEAIANKSSIDSLKALIEIERATNSLIEARIDGDTLDQTYEQRVKIGVLAVDTEFLQQQEANLKAKRSLENANRNATASRLVDAAQYVASLGPTDDERRRAEQDQRDAAWAAELAKEASLMARQLKLIGPYDDADRCYAFVAYRYYWARFDHHDEDAAVRVAAEQLLARKKSRHPISDSEAEDHAKQALQLYRLLKRKEAASTRAQEKNTREEQELEISRNNLRAAELRDAANEKLGAIIHGKKDEETHFDPRT